MKDIEIWLDSLPKPISVNAKRYCSSILAQRLPEVLDFAIHTEQAALLITMNKARAALNLPNTTSEERRARKVRRLPTPPMVPLRTAFDVTPRIRRLMS